MIEAAARAAIVRAGARLVQRGLVHGTTGNISVRTAAGILMTPTGSGLDELAPESLALIAADGAQLAGEAPTKEWRLHLAAYDVRPDARAVVHTHSVHSVAVSLLDGLDPDDLLPPLTPYYLMRVGSCALSPYRVPGDRRLADDIRALAPDHRAVILAHHGPVVIGTSLDDAVAALEELEMTAQLFCLVYGKPHRLLDAAAVAELRSHDQGR